MEIVINPPLAEWERLCRRNIPADDPAVAEAVSNVARQVSEEGDKALIKFAKNFDGVEISSLELSPKEIEKGAEKTTAKVKEAIETAARNIERFHRAQIPHEVDVTTTKGVRCVQRAVPIQRVGLYIPGGRAPLFSTVLMLAIPARIAGCREIILCTPEGVDKPIAPEILYAARHCGVNRIFRIGGSQAIAAMALGTESVPKVDKIFGPGNRYVTKAKQLLSSVTAIDMPAGPSEVMVLADSSASAEFVAADMLSQAEHGPDSQAILVCDNETFAISVDEAVKYQANHLSRASSVEASLAHSRIIVMPDRNSMISFANRYASEHLIISMENPWDEAARITAAGSIFIGNYSPESAGDYASGTNHTLPTGGWARSFSGVNIDSFIRKITYQEISADGLRSIAPTIITMADAEGLDAHAAAVKIRIDNDNH